MSHDWVDFAKQLRSIAQTGQTYTTNHYELERYRQLEALTNQMFAVLGDVSIEQVENFIIPESGYATPKVDVRGAVFVEDRVLLVRERKDGRWTLPGGWADVCEAPSVGVLREILEESGHVADNPRLAMLKDRSLHPYQPATPDHIYKLFYICDHQGGEFVDNNETDAADFFSLDALPPLSMGRTLAEDILECHAFASGRIDRVHSD
ncbi:NUDIX hydrolase [Kushneria phosphatilytica]|uniref:NUDIX hydrolase n=1 Tax=Kushneria phosphatilytica TaxID=657387 RepID=A0A1S1NXS9_9GAMM|nr:NUDIX hydrolase [Kushneria phosphatilytica]OHV13056.1 ADP-ribose pyrophosphatase [Kushneria phosphatilytica]QEL10928.1 NUDIX hydrolase [Kushneria phosphatilytica]